MTGCVFFLMYQIVDLSKEGDKNDVCLLYPGFSFRLLQPMLKQLIQRNALVAKSAIKRSVRIVWLTKKAT